MKPISYKGYTEEKELCWECTGSGIMGGNYPCKVCRATGYLPKEEVKKKHEVLLHNGKVYPYRLDK